MGPYGKALVYNAGASDIQVHHLQAHEQPHLDYFQFTPFFPHPRAVEFQNNLGGSH